MTGPPLRGLRGFLIDAPERGRLRGVRDGAMLIEDGVIVAVGPFSELQRHPDAGRARWLHSPEAVIVPGFAELFTRPARYAACGLPPGGAAARDRAFHARTAEHEAPLFFEALARHGITSAVCELPPHEAATNAFAEAAERRGLRVAFGFRDHGSAAERLGRRWHGASAGRLRVAFTSPDLAEAALLARKYDAILQAAVSAPGPWMEELPRLALLRLTADFPPASLTFLPGTAVHAPLLDATEGCPPAPVGRWLAADLAVGLASGAGDAPTVDPWAVQRGALRADAERARDENRPPVLTSADVFHFATAGGARALGGAGQLGTFDVGNEADATVIDLAAVLPYGGRGNMHADLAAADVIHLLVQRGGPAAVIETFVRGVSVYRAPAPGLL